MTLQFQPPAPQSPFAAAIAFLAAKGITVTPADGFIPGLCDLSGAMSARNVTMGQVMDIAHQQGMAPLA